MTDTDTDTDTSRLPAAGTDRLDGPASGDSDIHGKSHNQRHPYRPHRSADRYGRRARPATRWRAVLLVAVALVACVGATVFAYRNLGGAGLSSAVTAFRTADDHVDVTFVVRRDNPGKTAVCLVRARSGLGIEVGSAMVPVPPGDSTARITYRLDTSTRPVTGEVTGCRYRGAD